MKSGSTYVSKTLCRYFNIENPEMAYDWQAEHNMTGTLRAMVRGRPFCLNFHMLPHVGNIVAFNQDRIGFVGLWRNLGDMIVSYDDHQFREPGPSQPFFLLDPAKYMAMEPEARVRFMIDTVTPWYLSFYLRWRAANGTLRPYERMVEDQRTFFAEMMIEDFVHPPIMDRLDQVLAVPAGPGERFNAGRVGRSAERLSDANKKRLEERILEHPDVAQLEILLWELPWDVPALAPVSPYDGKVVRTASDDTPFFVSRGHAYPVRTTWLAGRVGERRSPRVIPDAELAGLPRGEQLL
ncbi:MAG: hypothetical protein JWO85_884 [Candidatus Eremiobacteraeota bacterium]|nr:hypothetical protein [Candidatus Eremiobacteraeota bacterium]